MDTKNNELICSNAKIFLEPKELNQKKNFKYYVKKYCKRYFIDAFSGMAQGLFVTLIAGTILKTLGNAIGANWLGNFLVLAGSFACILMGAGIGAGIATHLKANKLVVFATIVAGFIGAYSEQFLGANFMGGSMSSLTVLLNKGIPGNPIGAYICSLMACELGQLVSGKTKLDILLVPLVCLFVSIIGAYVAWPFIWLIKELGVGISMATQITPFFMGVIISVVMGILLTMPTSSAAIWVSIAMNVTTDSMLIAGGAAVVGCSCQMIGFAVSSFRENRWSGIVSQGLGTSMLQIPNIMKHPKIFIPPIIASAILGPLSTCVFKLRCNASGGGMGTSGLVGIFGVVDASTGVISPAMMWCGIILLMIVLPAIITLIVSEIMRKTGAIKYGDMKLDV